LRVVEQQADVRGDVLGREFFERHERSAAYRPRSLG
jgi:hypothetical protein